MIFFLLLSSLAFADGINIPPLRAATINLEKAPPAPLKVVKPSGPVYLDARPAFDYAMGHLPLALSIRWSDYSQVGDGHKGVLDPDLGMLARKLCVMGINPDREVVVYGLGPKGNGEEGRIAWMLSYLGIKKIVVQNMTRVQGRKTTDVNAQNTSSAIWIPHPNDAIRARRSEMERVVSEEKVPSATLIDVRSESDFKAKHIPGAINIEWKKFTDKDGEMAYPELVKKVLTDEKVDLAKLLIFYGSQGVESGYATFAALRAGLNAKNDDGSFAEWFVNAKNTFLP